MSSHSPRSLSDGTWAVFSPVDPLPLPFSNVLMMAEDSESAASQQSLELDDQDTCGIDGDNEEENENAQGCGRPVVHHTVYARVYVCVCVLAG